MPKAALAQGFYQIVAVYPKGLCQPSEAMTVKPTEAQAMALTIERLTEACQPGVVLGWLSIAHSSPLVRQHAHLIICPWL